MESLRSGVPRVSWRLRMQRGVAHATALLWLPALALALRVVGRWRIDGSAELRACYARIRRDDPGPLLVCPNHLTMIDSALVAWALGSPGLLLRRFDSLPWNLPEQDHFAANPFTATLAFVLKCLPIHRGGSRKQLASVLANATALLANGDVVLVFPEGRRSRSGRVERDAVTWGAGRLVAAVPNCRVLCVHLRGERQSGMDTLPARGQTFRVDFQLVEPKSEQAGLRRSLDLTQQILATLAALEARHFDARQ